MALRLTLSSGRSTALRSQFCAARSGVRLPTLQGCISEMTVRPLTTPSKQSTESNSTQASRVAPPKRKGRAAGGATITSAATASAPATTPPPVATSASSSSSDYASSLPRISLAEVDAIIQSEPVVVLIKSYCPFCVDLCDRLTDSGIPHRVIALDHFQDGNSVRDQIKLRTGAAYVPFVFVRGEFVDSDEVLNGLKVATGSPPGSVPSFADRLLRTGLALPAGGFYRP